MRQQLAHGSTTTRLFVWTLVAMALVVVIGGIPAISPVARAQPEEALDDADEDAGDDDDDDDAAAGDQSTDEGATAPSKNLLQLAFKALGWGYMAVFLLLSFTLVALFIMNMLEARRDNVCPNHLVDTFEERLKQKQYQEAYDAAKADESVLGRVLADGLAKLSSGYSQAIEAMQEVGEMENMRLEHRLSYMALIGTISPMVGLFGTVHGMIKSFRTIAENTSTPSAQKLADGISTALFTTLVGLAIAIPAIVFYNILKNRISRLVLEVGVVSEGLMSQFQNRGKK